MNIVVAIVLFIVGLAVVIYFAEKLVKGAVGTSLGFGISIFLVSVIFIGFDPENLAVGAIASFEEVPGIALGSIIGAAMVAIAFAFGITALIVPMRFEQAPRRILAIPVLAVLLMGILAMDGQLSRIDGGILLVGFAISIAYLIFLSRGGLDIKPSGEVGETLEEAEGLSKWKSLGLLALSLAAITAGSQIVVMSSEVIIGEIGISDTVFGMTILAFLVSIEELARMLPAARKGRSEITYANVAGSILAFFLFNAGIIALVRPVPVDTQTLTFFLPFSFGTTIVISLIMMARKMPRWSGALLLLLYFVFVIIPFI